MRYTIPKNIGKVRVMMALGGRYAVWNGKDGRMKFEILCRTRQQADTIAKMINSGQHHGGEIEVETR